jgi:2-dehydro-3-deoxyphosphogluconate aldolase / (4S)-4-hydroxy-2-oxoglutarate aldolase
MSNKFNQQLFEACPIIGIMRNIPSDDLATIAEIYYKSGLTCLEITMNSDKAEEHIKSLSAAYEGHLNIGAGTVCDESDLSRALTAGAQFIVTPIINAAVITICVRDGITIFPGAYTPSEIYQAWKLGAQIIKVFPAGVTGPKFIKEVLAPLNKVKLMPTGGIGLANFRDFLCQGAVAVGIGSQLFPPDVIAKKEWQTLAELFGLYKKTFDSYLQRPL